MVTRVPNTELLAIKDQFGIQDPFLLKDYNDYMMDLVEEAQATGGVPAATTQGGGGEGGIFSGVRDFRSGAPGAKNFLFKDDDTPVDIRNITDKDFFSRIFGDAYDPYKREPSGIQVSGLPEVGPLDSYDDLDDYLSALNKAGGVSGTQTIPDAPFIKEAIPEKKGLSGLFEDVKKGAGSLKDFIMSGGITGNIIRGLAGERDPRFTAVRSYYGGDDRSNLDSIGRIRSGLMAGYAPVSGGLRIGTNFDAEGNYTGGTIGGPTRYGLQRAYQKRIDSYNKYIERNQKKLQDKFSQKLFDKIQRQKKMRERLAREKAAELRVLQEAQRRKDQQTVEDAYRTQTGEDSGYSGGFDRQTGNYDDPFDPGFAD
jgi:hypothetical protein